MAIISSKSPSSDSADRSLQGTPQPAIPPGNPGEPDPAVVAPPAPDDRPPAPAAQPRRKARPKATATASSDTPEPSTILAPEARPEEAGKSEESLRPQSIADYVGQKALKEVLHIAIHAAKARKESLDHLLLYGPPGLGKTTMSLVLAQEMGVSCKITTAPALERPRDIVGLLVNLQPGDLLFIDEIHRLSKVTEEILYPAMEDFRIDVTIGKGQGARTRSLPLKPFTLVGATTQIGALT
ncbi:AAA family ATPase, partial [Prochlorothrix hollandica]|uniref:AAA family ATPase n=1 Tax=Prochlorothrix hollandica TaxID=1223 RepID=UPI003340F21A